MKLIKDISFVIFSFILSLITAYLTWLAFHYLSVYLISLHTWWVVLIYFCTGVFLVPFLLGGMQSILLLINIPTLYLSSKTRIANVIPTVIYGFFCFSNIRELWTFPICYDVLTIIVAVIITFTVIPTYFSYISFIWKETNHENE